MSRLHRHLSLPDDGDASRSPDRAEALGAVKLGCGREPDEYALPCHRPDRARSSYWSDLLQTRRCQGSPASAGPDVAIADNESLAPQQRYGTESDMADDFSFQTSSVRTMYRSRHRCTAGTATYLQLRLTAYTAAGGPELPKCRACSACAMSTFLQASQKRPGSNDGLRGDDCLGHAVRHSDEDNAPTGPWLLPYRREARDSSC
ncbi:hypothetical protein ACCO45_011774 [Purpureocillium lilacinum]|uniref:Uncharacterized protein n=1 Tax=Purpureocillium lilacinum TaxID=33203 RepID=A0ACC4DCG5_PURLI